MKKHFIFLIFIFLVNCSFNESELGISSNNISKNEAESITDESCRKLLANPNTETFRFEIEEE